MSQLICHDLTLGYEGKILVSRLDFRVDAGDYLCIVGENGSGKSTLIRTLLGLQSPLSGTVETGDGLTHTAIGYLPQQTPVQRDFPASVREIVRSGCLSRLGAHPFYTKDAKAKAEQAMERMGISHLAGRCYRTLSGGQQQRVLLARALCATEKMLLLDEPVAGLDPVVTADMYRLIAELNQRGITILMISHDIGAALTYASHILHIGDPCWFGSKAEYLASEPGKRFVKGGDAPWLN